MIDTAVILAGGLGTRLRSLVPDKPKTLAPVNGRPFITYILDYLINQGICHVIISIGYLYQQIIDFIGFKYNGIVIQYVIEDIQLGTGGALNLVIDKCIITSPFILLNGDTYFPINLNELIKFSHSVDADWCFSLFKSAKNSRFLNFEINTEGKIITLQDVNDKKNLSYTLCNAGIYLVNPRRISEFKLKHGIYISLEEEIFPLMLQMHHKVFGKYFNESFIDIGIPEDFAHASNYLK